MIEDLEKRIADLEQENHDLYDDLERLQEEILEKDAIISELQSSKGSKKATMKALKSQIAINLELKEKENRELKDKLGFLRKEKIKLQQELEKHTKNSQSTVIPIVRKQKPLNSLVEDLQATIAKLRAENKKLANEKDLTKKYDKIINQKDNEIELLQTKITELYEKIKTMEQTPTPIPKTPSFTKDLNIELQEKLNKTRLQLEAYKRKLDEYEKTTQVEKTQENYEVEELKAQIISLKQALDAKDSRKGESTTNLISTLTVELQEKLNNARAQITTLQEKIKVLNEEKVLKEEIVDFKTLMKLKGELKEEKEKNKSLKKKINEQERILDVKEKRIISLTNKAKNTTIKDEKGGFSYKAPVALRLRELSGIIDDLKKENSQQRQEILHLRNNETR
ncbi:MAG: hypothetical protein ACFFAS_10645 [Promethearchaeota archaeon]